MKLELKVTHCSVICKQNIEPAVLAFAVEQCINNKSHHLVLPDDETVECGIRVHITGVEETNDTKRMRLEEFKDHVAEQVFGETKAEAQAKGTCLQCKKPFTDENVHSEAGWRDTKIVGMCEDCIDGITG